jgi:hypothetical protein
LCAHNDLDGIGILDSPGESGHFRHHYHHLFNNPDSENRTLAWRPKHAYFELLSIFGGTDYSLDNCCGYLVYDTTTGSGAWDTVPIIMSSKSDDINMLTDLQELILAGSVIRKVKDRSKRRNEHIDEVLGLLNQRYVCKTLVSYGGSHGGADRNLQAFWIDFSVGTSWLHIEALRQTWTEHVEPKISLPVGGVLETSGEGPLVNPRKRSRYCFPLACHPFRNRKGFAIKARRLNIVWTGWGRRSQS